jgi:hypothetical protein
MVGDREPHPCGISPDKSDWLRLCAIFDPASGASHLQQPSGPRGVQPQAGLAVGAARRAGQLLQLGPFDPAAAVSPALDPRRLQITTEPMKLVAVTTTA